MAAMEHMTWVRSQKRWTKQYRTKTYSVSCRQLGTAATKEGSRAAANDWWEMKQEEVDQKAQTDLVEREPVWLKERAIQYDRDGSPTETYKIVVGRGIHNMFVAAHCAQAITERVASEPLLSAVDKSGTMKVGVAVADFLKRKREQVDAQGRSAGRSEILRTHLFRFRDWFGADQRLMNITAETLDNYYSHVLKQIQEDSIRPYYGRDLFASVKQLIRWCSQRDLLAVPKNIDSREFTFELNNQIVTLSDDEISALLSKANDRMTLYILLMLNCGMTQKDISDLKHSQVLWKLGKLKRKRSKTRRRQGTPEVEYPLWDETLRLLMEERSDDEDRVLVNANGEPLKREWLDGEQYLKVDNIKTAWNRLAKAVDIKKPPKLLRKTAASKLESHETYGRYVNHFLGHSPKSMADRHYVVPSQERFDEAIRWLGEQFDL